MTGTLAPVTVPVTDSQASLLVTDRIVGCRPLYNTVTEIDIAPVDEPTLRSALADLVALQPALRTEFASSPTISARVAEAPATAEIDLDWIEADDVEPTVARLGAHHFDLIGGSLYRFAYVCGERRSTLVLLAHHLVFDGYSLTPITADLAKLLGGEWDADQIAALRTRREAALRAELDAQLRAATDPRTVEHAAAWADTLRAATPQRLYPRPNAPIETDFTGERLDWHLDAPESAALAEACRRYKVTPFGFFLGVYGAVLARHTASESVTIGVPFMARRTVGAYDLCGFFVNTLPVLVAVDGTEAFDDYLRGRVLPAIDYARSRVTVAFNQIVAQLRPDRSSNRNPVFSAMLAMSDTVRRSPDGPVRVFRERGNRTAKFDIWFGVTPVDDTWRLELEYDVELLPRAVVDDLRDSLRRAILTATAPDAPASVDALFADAGPAIPDDGLTVAAHPDDLDAWIATADPRTPAVDGPEGVLTYGELAALVARAATGLRDRGVDRGDVVGLHGERLTDTIVAMLALLRVGAAYLPLDAELPVGRLEYMVQRAGARLVIGSMTLPGTVSVTVAELAGAAPDDRPAEPPDAVYVMFSSGSTGQPKGIAMGEGPLVNLTAWQIAALEMDTTTRFMQYAPLGFDVSFQEIVPTLAAGGTVVSREPADRRDFHALVERIAATRTTHVYLPVAALRSFVQAAADRSPRLPDLRYLCVSGEQLILDERSRAFIDANPHITLVNLYGPTETHAVTTARFTAADGPWPAHAPIGVPLYGVAAYVVDRGGRLAPRGVPGELFLGGLCPARGYINDPERTAAGFVPDRFAGTGIMYRTGDQVMRDDSDTLLFLGRNDEQVKIRGYRVELGEIEAVANGVTGVRRAVAATREARDGRELLLFVVGEAEVDTVRDVLRAELPAYMVPVRIFDVERIPLTVNGKSDRAALLAEAAARVEEETRTDVPVYRDDLERELAALWGELLEVEAIPADASLLECGAHSLSVFAGLGQVERAYGASMSIAEFFRTPTIAALADSIRRAGRA